MRVPSGAVRRVGALAVLLLARPSAAQPAPPDPARLHYDRPSAFGSCPTEPYFRSFIAARFGGVDPFTDTAPRRVEVKVRRDKGAGWVVELAMLGEDGKSLGGDELSASTCVRAVEDAASRVVSWLLPILGPPDPPPVVHEPAARAAPPVEPAPAETPPAAPEPAKPDPTEPPVRVRFVPRVGVGARMDVAAAWGTLFGVTIEGGFQRPEWRWGGWSLMGTLRWAPRQTGIGPPSAIPSVDVNSEMTGGTLTGCVHRAWPVSLAGCVLAELGEVQQTASSPTPLNLHQAVLLGGGGVGARVEARLYGPLYVQIAADVRGVARLAGGTSRWANVIGRGFAGGATGDIGAGVGASF
jgi:hypothetical protein